MSTALSHRLRNLEFNSAIARQLLSRLYRVGEVYRIPVGPMRGLRLRYHNSVNFHAMLGLWELSALRLLDRLFDPGGPLSRTRTVADVGANIGAFAMWFSRRVGPSGRVYAFEPAPGTMAMLRDNLAINSIENVSLVEAACSDHSGTVDFYVGRHHHVSSLHAAFTAGEETAPVERLTVRSTTLDDFFHRDGRKPPEFIKIDIEGGGTFALRACDDCVAEAQPVLLVESHTPDEDRAISDLVVRTGYSAYRLEDTRWVRDVADTHPNPDGVWGTLLLVPTSRRGSFAAVLGRD